MKRYKLMIRDAAIIAWFVFLTVVVTGLVAGLMVFALGSN